MIAQAKILVVDDIPDNVELLAALLRKNNNYHVSTALNGLDAIEKVQFEKPDLILLDIVMPGMSGFEVCERVKANEVTQEIPVIFITATNDPFNEAKGFQVGAVDFIIKPISPQTVLARVNTHLELKKKQESLQELSSHLEQRVREEVEKNLKGERRYQNLVETMRDGLCILDKDRRMSFMNDRFCEIVGHTRESMFGKLGEEILGFACMQRFFRQLEACEENQNDCDEITFIKKDGTTSHAIVSPKPLFDNQGRLEGSFATVIDITERKKVEDELAKIREELEQRVEERTKELSKVLEDLTKSIIKREQLENNLQAVLNNTRFIIFIKDLQGRYVLTNKMFERLICPAGDTILGCTDLDFFPANVATRLQKIDQEVLESRSYRETEEEIPQEDGVHIYLTSKFPLLSVRGELRGVCGIATDITERKQMEKALRQAHDELEKRVLDRTRLLTETNEALAQEIENHRKSVEEKLALQEQAFHAARLACLGEMSANVAHEINNPNVSIRFNAEVLMGAWQDVVAVLEEFRQEHGEVQIGGLTVSKAIERFPKLQNDIMRNSVRIKGIVENFKRMSRRKSGDLNDLVDVREVLRSAVSILEIQIKKHTKHLTMDFPETLPDIQGNFQQLEQVFINVIQNALQSLPDRHRKIHGSITLENGKDNILVMIRDEGMGISAAHLNRVVEPFFSTKLEAGGTGLGLSISSTILKNHQGTMTFESEPGHGTKVSIRLPLKRDQGNISQ